MEENNKETVFKIIPNGPIHVSGSFQIKGTDGKMLSIKDEAYLCRCGGSKNKPFCDSTHKTLGVKD